MKNNLIQDKAIELMIEAVYEDESSRKNWDSSFIESIRNFYYEKGGLTEKQLTTVERRYANLKHNQGEGRSYERN